MSSLLWFKRLNKGINLRKKTNLRFLFVWITLCFSSIGIAQPRGPFVISPQVNPDNTVVFRYHAPSAKDVKLNAQFEKAPITMTKDDKGIWSVTVGPLNQIFILIVL